MKKTVPFQFTCTADAAAALDYYAKGENRSRSNTVQAIIDSGLILRPNSLAFLGFPPEQSIRGWIESNQRRATAGTHFVPINPFEFSDSPLTIEGAMQRVNVRVSLQKDSLEALRYAAKSLYGISVSRVVWSIVRAHLIRDPLKIKMPDFPRCQSLYLWVRANIEREKFGGHEVSPLERFGLKNDASRVVRFDYATAG